jgi:hypothetical protein
MGEPARFSRWFRGVVMVGLLLAGNPVGLRAQFDGTARDWLGVAEGAASEWQSDAVLLYVLGLDDGLYAAGEASNWTYLFGSASDDSLLAVVVTFGIPILSEEVGDTFLLDPLPDGWIDSDEAVAVAEANGGSEYRGQTGNDFIVAAAGRGLYLREITRPVWLFTYGDTLSLTGLLIYVDAVSGEFIDSTPLGIGDDGGAGRALPRALSLGPNYPNPFNPSTTIRYGLGEGEPRAIRLDVYDMRGRRVRTLFRGVREAGRYEAHWDGRDERGAEVGSGVYVVRLRSDREVVSRKMVLAR